MSIQYQYPSIELERERKRERVSRERSRVRWDACTWRYCHMNVTWHCETAPTVAAVAAARALRDLYYHHPPSVTIHLGFAASSQPTWKKKKPRFPVLHPLPPPHLQTVLFSLPENAVSPLLDLGTWVFFVDAVGSWKWFSGENCCWWWSSVLWLSSLMATRATVMVLVD